MRILGAPILEDMYWLPSYIIYRNRTKRNMENIYVKRSARRLNDSGLGIDPQEIGKICIYILWSHLVITMSRVSLDGHFVM
jgi:hypothetical protein